MVDAFSPERGPLFLTSKGLDAARTGETTASQTTDAPYYRLAVADGVVRELGAGRTRGQAQIGPCSRRVRTNRLIQRMIGAQGPQGGPAAVVWRARPQTATGSRKRLD